MKPTILQARPEQTAVVAAVLAEAATWLRGRGIGLWRAEDLTVEALRAEVAGGEYFLAWVEDEAGGVVKCQLEDGFCWPEAAAGEAVYLHRLAIRRAYAGGQMSGAILQWAAGRARELGRRYVRLDCAANRPRLRRVYEGFGFRFHSERDMGAFHIARYQYEVNTYI